MPSPTVTTNGFAGPGHDAPEPEADRFVFVVATAGDVELLRALGHEAVARPYGGLSTAAELAPFAGRTACILDLDPYGWSDRKRADWHAIAAVAASVSRLTPIEFLDRTDPPGDLAEWLRRLESAGHPVAAEVDRRALVESSLEPWTDTGDDEPEGESIEPVDDGPAWGQPRMLDVPGAPPFPLGALPRPLGELAIAAAESIGCPPDFTAGGGLAVAAGAAGRSTSLLLKPGYLARPSLFFAAVARPSSGKTPALAATTSPLKSIERALQERNRGDLDDWRASEPGPGKRPSGPAPTMRQALVDDTTMEALFRILANNPRGVTLYRDELSALFAGLNQYKAGGKGSDRANLIKTWSGEPILLNRVRDEFAIPTHVPYPAISILGGLQPDLLAPLAGPGGPSDGLPERFLYAYPADHPAARWSHRAIPDHVSARWESAIEVLHDRGMDSRDGREFPHVSRLSPSGLRAFIDAHDRIVDEMNDPGFPSSLLGYWGKLREYTGRLALVVALIRDAGGPSAAVVPTVEADDVASAAALAGYFGAMARRVWAVAAAGREANGAATAAVLAWIRGRGLTRFSENDLKQARRWIGDDQREAALRSLQSRCIIRPVPGQVQRTGRPASPVYDVNPGLGILTENPENPENPPSTGLGAPILVPFQGFQGFQGLSVTEAAPRVRGVI